MKMHGGGVLRTRQSDKPVGLYLFNRHGGFEKATGGMLKYLFESVFLLRKLTVWLPSIVMTVIRPYPRSIRQKMADTYAPGAEAYVPRLWSFYCLSLPTALVKSVYVILEGRS